MTKYDAREALLLGSYISSMTPRSLVPKVEAPEVSLAEVTSTAEELIADGLIVKLPGAFPTVTSHRFTCPYDITEKGKDWLGLPAGMKKADFSFIKIIVATGGSTVHNVEQKTQVITVQTFEQNMVKQIDASSASVNEKEEAKSKLQELLEHPLLSAALGAALGAALKA